MSAPGRAPDPPTVIFSSASYPPHAPFLLYTVIEAALAYVSYDSEAVEHRAVEVRLLPIGLAGPITRAFDVLYGAIARLRGRYRRRRPAVPPNGRSYARLAIAGRAASLVVGGVVLTVARYRVHPRAVVLYIRSMWTALRLWRRCYRSRRFDPLRFLDIAHRGIRLGDLAASEHIRFERRGAGRLHATPKLFLLLADCVFVCNFCLDELEVPSGAAVSVIELTYSHTVYKRALRARGLSVVEPILIETSGFRVVPASRPLKNPYAIDPPTRSADDHLAEEVRRYMESRLSDPIEAFPYMSGGNDNSRSYLATAAGEPVQLPSGTLSVVLFLHSFDDAQYLFETGGFSDLFDWTCFTLDRCLANRAIDRVLIKPHPSLTYENSRRAEALLRECYAGEPRVSWLAANASLKALATAGAVVGITHHGSVAEELVYLDIPVIAYGGGSWAAGYDFLLAWSHRDDYAVLLDGLSLRQHRRPTPAQRRSLLQYVAEYRLRDNAGAYDYFRTARLWLEAAGRVDAALPDDELELVLNEMETHDARDFVDFAMRSGLAARSAAEAQRVAGVVAAASFPETA
jgi:hypothetical protein